MARDVNIGVPRLNVQGLTVEKVTEMLDRLEKIETSTNNLTRLVEQETIDEIKAFLEDLVTA